MRSRTFLSLLMISLGLTACTSGRGLTSSDQDAFRESRHEHTRIEVPLIVQEKNHCGPAVLTMALRQNDSSVSLETITNMTFTPGAEGSFQTDLLAAARRSGFAPYQVPDLAVMMKAVDEGYPVVVFQNLGLSFYPVWHYALLTGYDREAQTVFLHTGDQAYARTPFLQLAKTWDRADRWSYVMLPPSQIPSWVSLDEALGNADVFSREGQSERAMALYRAISAKFPAAYEGPAGLGIEAAGRGEDQIAIAAFREALTRSPDHEGLRHNLDQVLSRSRKQRVQ